MAITPLPTPPSRKDPLTFSPRTDQFLSALSLYRTELNSLAENVEQLEGDISQVLIDTTTVKNNSDIVLQNSNDILLDSQNYFSNTELFANGLKDDASDIYNNVALFANYKGSWSELTGSLEIPAVVGHNNTFWQLTENLADVTSEEPSANSLVWSRATATPVSNGDIGDIIYTPNDLETTTQKFLECDGRVLLQSSYPELFEKIGTGEIPLPTSMVNFSPSLPNAALGCSFSPDGQYFAIAHQASPFISIYKKDGSGFVKLPDPSVIPTSNAQDCSFSKDGDYLVVASAGNNPLIVYERDGDTFNALTNPSGLPSSFNSTSVTFDPFDDYIYLGISSSPWLIIIELVNGDLELKSLTGGDPTGTVNNISVSSQGLVCCTHDNSPFVTTYLKDNGDFIKQSNINPLPSSNGRSSVFSKSGDSLIVSATTTLPRIYPIVNNLIGEGDVLQLATLSPNEMQYFNENILLVTSPSNSTTPFRIFKVDGLSWEELTIPYDTLQSGSSTVRGLSISDNKYLVVAFNSGQRAAVYKPVYPFDESTEFALPEISDKQQNIESGWFIKPIKAYIRSES